MTDLPGILAAALALVPLGVRAMGVLLYRRGLEVWA